MTNWINYPTTLTGLYVDLFTLEKKHFPDLEALAKDDRIWKHFPYDCSNSERFYSIYNSALQEREKGNQYPFIIFHKDDNKIIGSTRFLDIQQKNKKLEIGATWLHPSYWGTKINIECKLLLLTYCFETLQAIRVQLKTDENNIRSRKAIEKIGGQYEGVLRNDMLRDNKSKRNSAYYSIIEEEWLEKKMKLNELLQSQ